jgi:hypothetical protein
MSDADNNAFTGFAKLVPGFDFLQNLTKQATGAAKNVPGMPDLGSWVAPTISVEEVDKRIAELKAVQFWLDQNATALKATIQALEVQKMTLSTLQGMNVNMAEMAKAFQMKMPDSFSQAMNAAGGGSAASVKADKADKSGDEDEGEADADSQDDHKAHQFPGLEVPETAYLKRLADAADKPKPDGKASRKAAAPAAPAAEPVPTVPAVVDPLQWWGALTQQFQGIAAQAMKEVTEKSAVDLTKNPVGDMAKDAVTTATGLARDMADTATKTLTTQASGARDLMTSALRAQPWPVPAKSSRPAKAPAGKTADRAPAKAPPPAKKASAAGKKNARAGDSAARKTAKPARKSAAPRSR